MKTKAIFLVLFIFMTGFSKAQWQQINGLKNNDIRCLALKGTNIFAGAYYDSVFFSINNGNSWTKVNNGMAQGQINNLVVSVNNIFAGTLRGVCLSANNGTSWAVVNNGLTNTFVTTLTINGNNLYAGTTSSGNVFLSTNNGSNWTNKSNGLTCTTVWSIITSGINIIAGTNKGVFVSTNGGSNWTPRNYGLTDSTIFTLAVIGTDILAGTISKGVFLSTDYGKNWISKNNGITSGSFIYAFAVNGSDIFTSTSTGIYYSKNKGISWKNVDDNLPAMSALALLIYPPYIYAGTSHGIWKRLLSEMTGINENNESKILLLYPDPADDYITIELSDNLQTCIEIEIYDQFGRKVISEKCKNQESLKIDIKHLNSGVYLVKSKDENCYFGRFVKM